MGQDAYYVYLADAVNVLTAKSTAWSWLVYFLSVDSEWTGLEIVRKDVPSCGSFYRGGLPRLCKHSNSW